MRSTALHFPALVLPLVLLGATAFGGGCGANELSGSPDENGDLAEQPPTRAIGDTTFAGIDGGVGSPARGSPLCGVTPGRCMPDDETSCAAPDDDAGDASTPDHACRITRFVDTYVASCADGADPKGVDGARCSSGADCAPGFDCVLNEDGPDAKESVCRRYCCSGSCASHTSQNGGPTFCDIQELVDGRPHMAPVCMPLKKCRLLEENECTTKETCAVVTETGDTGCVLKGEAEEGQPCEERHCEANLTCLGTPGERRCYRLCRVDGDDCKPTQKCTTGSLFGDPSFGVCKELMSASR